MCFGAFANPLLHNDPWRGKLIPRTRSSGVLRGSCTSTWENYRSDECAELGVPQEFDDAGDVPTNTDNGASCDAELYPCMLFESMAFGAELAGWDTYLIVSDGQRELDDLSVRDIDSLLNKLHMKREEAEQVVSQIMRDCSDDSWKLNQGDIVYVGDDVGPSVVIRNGFGQYECEVRVAGASENLGDRKAGRWVKTDRCFKLEVGDTIVTKADVVDATEHRREILQGTECIYLGRDDDNDVLIGIGSDRLRRQLVVFKEDISKFTLQ